jgi:acetyl-CoA carboxylase biotin carboxylase subunit
VEFLVDANRDFYFLEMNTRLQVEHPVTEMVTSLDLVKLQIQIAAGEALPFSQDDIALRGHAIECRLYAEDPDNNFLPSPGTICEYRAANGPGIRMDDGVYSGWTVPNEYDPMLGKLIAWGNHRGEAIARLRGAITEIYATGIKTNLALFARILADDDFASGDIYTRWLDDFLAQEYKTREVPNAHDNLSHEQQAAILAAALWHQSHSNQTNRPDRDASESPWKSESRRQALDREPWRQTR